MITRHIPNIITLLNLFCGCTGIVLALSTPHELFGAALMIPLAAILDYFDGFAARLLHVKSELGKQLDSLADVVTFGVLPAVLMYVRLKGLVTDSELDFYTYIKCAPVFLVAMFSALRLAKFNIDTRQTQGFIGMPTPANALFVAGLFLTLYGQQNISFLNTFVNPVFIYAYSVIASYIMIAEIPMLSLKFSSFDFASNQMRYFLLVGSVVFLVISAIFGFTFLGFSLSILYYIVLSIITFISKKA
ncbi:MAG: CDP-diacylglycerol--serine O-phosphatidyltransferase [Cytophagales bacterium]